MSGSLQSWTDLLLQGCCTAPLAFCLPLHRSQQGPGKQQEGHKVQHGTARHTMAWHGTVVPPARHCQGLPRKRPASSPGSIPTCSQWLAQTQQEVYFLIGLLALQMAANYFASLRTSSPAGFQVEFLHLRCMYNTDLGNNDLTFKVMKKKGSHRDIKAIQRQIQVK